MAGLPEELLPSPSKAKLQEAFLGKRLQDVPMPAAILDRAVVQRNCDHMLNACQSLGVDFRPHVKTHKTQEVAQLQVGSNTNDVRILFSTLAEAEHLLDYLLNCHKAGKKANVLYGIPIPESQVRRLACIGQKLGIGSISILVDNVFQLSAVNNFKEITGFQLQIFIKVDTGYHRAGLRVSTAAFESLLQAILDLESEGTGVLVGFYSHAGHSYSGNSPSEAMNLLMKEIQGLMPAANEALSLRASRQLGSPGKLILSVGATPTATSIKNLPLKDDEKVANLKAIIEQAKEGYSIELHAGVYPFLDMQQLATRASPSSTSDPRWGPAAISLADVALSILVEVTSFYADREKPEALIAAGTLALGRESCKSYEGWGIVSDWGMKTINRDGMSGWKVGRISQEHGILTRDDDGSSNACAGIHVGQRLRIWPNHACVAGAGFAWYLVVDSSLDEAKQDEIVDVWVRCRGW